MQYCDLWVARSDATAVPIGAGRPNATTRCNAVRRMQGASKRKQVELRQQDKAPRPHKEQTAYTHLPRGTAAGVTVRLRELWYFAIRIIKNEITKQRRHHGNT